MLPSAPHPTMQIFTAIPSHLTIVNFLFPGSLAHTQSVRRYHPANGDFNQQRPVDVPEERSDITARWTHLNLICWERNGEHGPRSHLPGPARSGNEPYFRKSGFHRTALRARYA